MIEESWRVLMADQSLCLLESFQSYLITQPKFLIVDLATSLNTIEQLLLEQEYDLLILGEQLSDASLLDAVKYVADKHKHMKIAAFCQNFSHQLLLQHNLKLINNLISKRESLSSVILAIHRIFRGELYITPYVQHLIRVDDNKNIVSQNESPISLLSPRQIKVLTLLANGLSVKEVARELHLSPKSVDSHKYRLMLKLHIKDRVELARFAIREGIIEA